MSVLKKWTVVGQQKMINTLDFALCSRYCTVDQSRSLGRKPWTTFYDFLRCFHREVSFALFFSTSSSNYSSSILQYWCFSSKIFCWSNRCRLQESGQTHICFKHMSNQPKPFLGFCPSRIRKQEMMLCK